MKPHPLREMFGTAGIGLAVVVLVALSSAPLWAEPHVQVPIDLPDSEQFRPQCLPAFDVAEQHVHEARDRALADVFREVDDTDRDAIVRHQRPQSRYLHPSVREHIGTTGCGQLVEPVTCDTHPIYACRAVQSDWQGSGGSERVLGWGFGRTPEEAKEQTDWGKHEEPDVLALRDRDVFCRDCAPRRLMQGEFTSIVAEEPLHSRVESCVRDRGCDRDDLESCAEWSTCQTDVYHDFFLKVEAAVERNDEDTLATYDDALVVYTRQVHERFKARSEQCKERCEQRGEHVECSIVFAEACSGLVGLTCTNGRVPTVTIPP